MKNTMQATMVREAAKELNASQRLKEIRDAYSNLTPGDRAIIRREALILRKAVRSYLSIEGAEEILSAVGIKMIELGE
jgi:hypothetical protein